MINFPLNPREKGILGEEIASKYLIKKGFSIVDKNYLRKWGEIDIIAKKEGHIHFVEVKSVLTRRRMDERNHTFRPEENVHVLKQRRLRRTIQTYFMDKRLDPDSEFFFHVAVVHMNPDTRRAHVYLIENVIL